VHSAGGFVETIATVFKFGHQLTDYAVEKLTSMAHDGYGVVDATTSQFLLC
jgi:hypothetical protein